MSTTVLDRFLDPLTECLTPDVAARIAGFTPDALTIARLEELREKANEGRLTNDERAEYAEFVETLDFVAILKSKARAALSRNGD